ncbi:MAG: M20/M25/M40 family metallo-hydrolase [Planctomycetaceae bacterium]
MTALDYTREFVAFDTVSVRSNVAVTDCIEAHLRRLGCDIERLEYDDSRSIRKATVIGKLGNGSGGMAYFAHSDVVPAADWARQHGPFEPTIDGSKVFGRGTCDMKGSLACMLEAVERISTSTLKQPVYITVTADEEVGMMGADQVAAESQLFREMVTGGSRGIIGEPTQLDIVYAHKGGTVIRVVSKGFAAHSSTRHGINANLAMIPFLAEMKAIHDETISDPRWQNNEFDPPTMCWNIGINDHTHAINITPPQSVCTVYFRKMPGINVQPLVDRVLNKAQECGIEAVETNYGLPLYVDPKSPYVQECLELAGCQQARTVGYGTDGARLTALEKLIVCGPGSIAQAHTNAEFIELEQLELGTDLYARMIERWCC